MAIRKLRKTLKPVIWAVTIAFVVSIFFIGSTATIFSGNQKNALEVNGKKIGYLKVERAIENNIQNYRNYYKDKVDGELVRMITVNNVIEESILVSEERRMQVAVNGKDVEKKYKEVTNGIASEKELKRMLAFQGLTIGELKKDIRNSLVADKVKEAVKAKYSPSTTEIDDYYTKNKEIKYENKPLADVKKKVEDDLKAENGAKAYSKWIEDKYAKAKIKAILPQYQDYIRKPVATIGSFVMDNIEFYNNVFMKKAYFGMPDDKSAYEAVIDSMKEEIGLTEEAAARKIVAKDGLSKVDAIEDVKSQLKEAVRMTTTYSAAELTAYFDKNKTKYETKESANIRAILLKVEATDADKKETKTKAEAVLKDALAGKPFADLAKTFSKDPGSAANGGDLGEFGKGQMVKEFEEACFKGEVGKVYPSLVKTQFGYHIIFVEARNEADKKVKAKHILIKEEASDKTKADVKIKADTILKDINDKKIEFDKAEEKYSQLDKKGELGPVYKGGYVPEIGYDQKISEEIFKLKENDVKLLDSEKGIVIVKMTKYTPFKAATLADANAKVVKDFTDEKATAEIEKIKVARKASIKVEIKDDKIKAIMGIK